MRIFVAGATGVIGRRLLPLLVHAGHDVWGTTRRPERAAQVAATGARPVVADAYDAPALAEAVAAAAPDVVVQQLTDLASEDRAANARLRIEGTRNLVDAAMAAGVDTMLAQSIAWIYAPGAAPAVEQDPLDPDAPPFPGVSALETAVAAMPRGVVLRYGMLYGAGTWYARDGAMADRARAGELSAKPTWTPFLHADDAASAAVAALDWPAGPINVVDDEPATERDWLPVFCESVGAPAPPVEDGPSGRPVSNAKARELGWRPSFPSWREGFRLG
jgi:nucleoside-diphosphate-sugar epimerase